MTAVLGDENAPATKADVRRLHVRLDGLRDDLHEKFVTASDLALVRAEIDRVERDAANRIGRAEDWQTWAMRLVLGAVIIALVGLVLSAQVPA